ncbi:hypothetical protein ACFFRR_003456 [Megaselia abdita]
MLNWGFPESHSVFTVVIKIMEGNQRYIEIKRNLEHYNELIRLVLKVKDTELQMEIMCAINAIPSCINCMKKETAEKATQTVKDENYIALKYSDNQGKRKRKRSKKGPEVIPTPAQKAKIEILKQEVLVKPSTSTETLPQIPSTSEFPDSFVDEILKGNVTDVFPPPNDLMYIQNTMIREFITSLKRVDGVLPIQTAIKVKDFKLLQRQLFVLGVRQIDLNSIFTEEDENLLELAIRSKCSLEYFEKLIHYGMKFDTINCFDDSILYVVGNISDDEELFSFFLKKLPLDFLMKLNSDGFSVFHICVKRNKFKMIQVLLDHIDGVLGLNPLKLIDSEDLNSEDMVEKAYKRAFLNINERKQIHKTKEGILNLKEIISGRTSLMVALSSNQIHIAYMLLNHWADPSVVDLSGCDCQSLLNNDEKTKNKHLEDVIVNVTTILKELRNN